MKRTVSWITVIAVTVATVAALCGCQTTVEKEKFTDYSFDYFDTVTSIVGYETDKETFDAVCTAIKEKLAFYHNQYTIYTTMDGINNLAAVNAADEPLTVDRAIIDLLVYAKEMYTLTNGQTNVALGSVTALWHTYREEGIALPPSDRLQQAAQHTHIDQVKIDRTNNTVFLAEEGLRLDVGALGKGYAVEMVARWMQQQGYTGYLLNVGGNVRAVGSRPDGEGWRVGIENPLAETTDDAYAAQVTIHDKAVVTSGSYQRYYTVDGIRYHHIIDPDTLYPHNTFVSVSVLCEHSGQGDALSTALFCMTYEEGRALVDSLADVEAMWILADGTTYYSDGFTEYVTA